MKTHAEVKVWHARQPTFFPSKGQVLLDEFELVARFDLRLPSVDIDMDAHRFASAAYRLTQNIDLAWGAVREFLDEGGKVYVPEARSTSVGDLISVHIDGAHLRMLEVAVVGFLPVKVLIGVGTQRRKAA